jgi:dephospho-CoA kinase
MQIARVMSRDGLARSDAEARLAAQMPIDDKARRADHVIDTSGTFEETDSQVERIWEVLARQD